MDPRAWYKTTPLNEHAGNHKYCDPKMCPALLNGWRVFDYEGNALPGIWLTEEAAIAEGLCKRYLLSGYEVIQMSNGLPVLVHPKEG